MKFRLKPRSCVNGVGPSRSSHRVRATSKSHTNATVVSDKGRSTLTHKRLTGMITADSALKPRLNNREVQTGNTSMGLQLANPSTLAVNTACSDGPENV